MRPGLVAFANEVGQCRNRSKRGCRLLEVLWAFIEIKKFISYVVFWKEGRIIEISTLFMNE